MVSSMKARFEGSEGRIRLIEALRSQRLVEGDEVLATALADAGELAEYPTGTHIITQGDADNDVHTSSLLVKLEFL